jgi:4-hydroxy-3-polyprenylbenzoate decarboxylase
MTYRNLQTCVADLERHGHLIRIEEPIDANLEAAEIHRRVFASGGPAILFENVVGCQFPMASNLFGTMRRVRFIFRKTIQHVQRLIDMKMQPDTLFRAPVQGVISASRAVHMLPRTVRSGPAIANETSISSLPQQKSWPLDGGAFVTLPIVYTEDVERPGLRGSNLGMYRIQLSGNEYAPDEEIGLHYQIHRGIGVHHAKAIAAETPFRVNVFVGGAPAMSVAAVMPLPEGMSELGFAGALGGHRIPMIRRSGGLPVYGDADFCITGTVVPGKLLPEGPFGDHLGYYSLAHDFPVLRVDKVYHRDGAIWPFTVVGRPPQEDTMFGEIIHELTSSAIPATIPGIRSVHAVDAAGVHPLLLAVGSERYVPFQAVRQPQEILTQANAILGQGQLSLTKYLFIAAGNEHSELNTRDIRAFFRFVLERIDLARDVHFQTCTTMDTLDYSGSSLNFGSKVVFAAAGQKLRDLPDELPSELDLPDGFVDPRLALPGVLVVRSTDGGSAADFCKNASRNATFNQYPFVILVDDSQFATGSLGNFLWVTFTRSNPAADIDGVEASYADKHWGCQGSLVIDARIKPHHAPPLVPDPDTARRVDAMATRGGPLAQWL